MTNSKLYTIDVKHHATVYKNIRIKTASDLKYWHLLLNPESYFFTRETMRFFGDTMRNYGIRHHETSIELYRKQPVKHGLNKSAFFDAVTFEHYTYDNKEGKRPE